MVPLHHDRAASSSVRTLAITRRRGGILSYVSPLASFVPPLILLLIFSYWSFGANIGARELIFADLHVRQSREDFVLS